jgi:hypothetical protein
MFPRASVRDFTCRCERAGKILLGMTLRLYEDRKAIKTESVRKNDDNDGCCDIRAAEARIFFQRGQNK